MYFSLDMHFVFTADGHPLGEPTETERGLSPHLVLVDAPLRTVSSPSGMHALSNALLCQKNETLPPKRQPFLPLLRRTSRLLRAPLRPHSGGLLASACCTSGTHRIGTGSRLQYGAVDGLKFFGKVPVFVLGLGGERQ